MKPFERAELLHPEPGREIGPQPSEGLGRGDWIGEARVGGDALFRKGEREEVGRVEVPRDNRTVSEEIGEPDEARSSPVGQVLRLRDVLRLESGDAQHVDAAHRVEPHHVGEGGDRLVQLIG